MDDTNKMEFFRLLTSVAQICQDMPNDARVRSYWDTLAPHGSIDDFRQACQALVRTWSYPHLPYPAAFLEQMEQRRMLRQSERTPEDWQRILAATERQAIAERDARFAAWEAQEQHHAVMPEIQAIVARILATLAPATENV